MHNLTGNNNYVTVWGNTICKNYGFNYYACMLYKMKRHILAESHEAMSLRDEFVKNSATTNLHTS